MDYGQVLKRAWHMVTRYRALWLFGIVLGIVTFSWEMSFLGGLDDQDQISQGVTITRLDGETFGDAVERTLQEEWASAEAEITIALRELNQLSIWGLERPPIFGAGNVADIVADIVAILAVLATAVAMGWILTRVVRYVSEAALIRMVGDYEDTGERVGVLQGLRLGVSRTAWRFFLIDLVIGIPVFLAFVLLFGLAFAPLVLGLKGSSTGAIVAGSLLTGGIFLAGIALAIAVSTLLTVLKRFFRQACALEDLGVLASIGRGWAVVKTRPLDVLVVWLIMLGVGLGWGLLITLSFLVLFPVLLGTILLGGVAGAVPAYLVFLVSSLVVEGALPVVLAILVGLPIFILVMLAPWLCLGGLMEVFKSSVWTLTYRELRGLESQPVPAPATDAASLEAASAA